MRLRPDTLALTAVLALMTALGPLSTDMYLPSLPDISARLGASVSQTQFTLSVFLLGFAAGQIVYGPFSDRYGRRPPLLVGFGLFILATALCAMAPTIDLLIAGRFFQALGASGPIVLARAVVRDLYDGPRAGREMARMGTIMGIVPAIAPTLGGILQAYFGWRASFVVTTAGAMVLCGVVYMLLPETLKQRSDASLSPFGIARSFASLLPHRDFLVYVALSSFTYGGLFAFISGSSFVLQGFYGLGPIVYGLSFTFCVVGYIAGTIVGRRLVSVRGMEGVIGIGSACLAAGSLIMLALVLIGTGSFLEIAMPMAIYTFGVGLLMPQAMASAMQPFGDRAGAASSFLGLVQMMVGAIVGVFVGFTVPYGAVALPATMAVLGVAAFLVFTMKGKAGSAAG
ncbi:MAG: multidrug effflux MFS transporter [Alsobacter sp.]|jgi:MFS transporter, DHA1 family, multidrug resistance protein